MHRSNYRFSNYIFIEAPPLIIQEIKFYQLITRSEKNSRQRQFKHRRYVRNAKYHRQFTVEIGWQLPRCCFALCQMMAIGRQCLIWSKQRVLFRKRCVAAHSAFNCWGCVYDIVQRYNELRLHIRNIWLFAPFDNKSILRSFDSIIYIYIYIVFRCLR